MVLLLAWLPYWYGFFPGLGNRDVEWQLRQIATDRFNDWHPVAHTLLLGLVSWVCGSLAAVPLVQIVIAAGLFAAILVRMSRMGTPRTVVWLVVAWLAICPSYGLNLVCLWKDVPFSLAVLWMTLL